MAILVPAVFWGCIFWLLAKDAKERAVSPTTWIVVVWTVIYASRPLTSWFGGSGGPVTPESYDEGNFAEAVIYFGLLLAAAVVLFRRSVRWGEVMRGNTWLTVFWMFWLVSLIWSDYPVITLKRWVKDFGNVLMALVVLTSPDAVKTMKAVFTRCAYLCIPLSVVLIRYDPAVGRTYGGWNKNELMYVGVTTHKNSLGTLALVSALFLLWDLLDTWREREPRKGASRVALWARIATLAMSWYLLIIANSATSLACAIVGSILLVLFTMPSGRRLSGGVEVLVVGFLLLDSLFGLKALVIQGLGRDMTLTTRTDIWPILMEYQGNPMLGAGFNSFWAGHRLVQLRDMVGGIIQAHNGYLETYLNGGVVGTGLLGLLLLAAYWRARREMLLGGSASRIGFTLVLIAIVYNFSEASFNKLNLLWFATVLAIMGYRGPVASWQPTVSVARPGPALAGHR